MKIQFSLGRKNSFARTTKHTECSLNFEGVGEAGGGIGRASGSSGEVRGCVGVGAGGRAMGHGKAVRDKRSGGKEEVVTAGGANGEE